MSSVLTMTCLSGSEARSRKDEIARLRLSVFSEYPYLYEGTLAYEEKYLETYFRAQHALLCLVYDGSQCVGASSGILAAEEEESFRLPLLAHGLDPSSVFYCGESVLLPAYRRQGWGKKFFAAREAFARQLPQVQYMAFAAVVREKDHPSKPEFYQPLDAFWQAQGYHPEAGLQAVYTWQDRGAASETAKTMQFWLKKLNRG